MFQAECASNEVVLMHTAQYGRLNMGRCVTEDFGFVGHCDYSVLAQMDRMCSGKHSCELKVEDPTFPSASPCHTDLKSFLYASYSCVPGKLHSRCNTSLSLVVILAFWRFTRRWIAQFIPAVISVENKLGFAVYFNYNVSLKTQISEVCRSYYSLKKKWMLIM